MDDKAAEKQVEQEIRDEVAEKRGLFHGGNLVLFILGVVAASFFVALIVWICVGAPPEEKKSNGESVAAPEVRATVRPKFLEDGRLCLITLPELKREDRKDTTPVLKLIRVKAGSFAMGDAPGRPVTLKDDFYIGETEVTQVQWKALMGIKKSGAEAGKEKKSNYTFDPSGERPEGSDNLPVDSLSWDEAMAFCARLNRDGFAPEGWMFTLPSETQWEFAARGGVSSQGYKFSGGDDLAEVAWCKSNNGRDETGKVSGERGVNRPVKGKKPNELGLYDMNGNVFEWCVDAYEKDPAKIAPEFPRADGADAVFRVIRGGCWYTDDAACTPTERSPMAQRGRGPYLGFRLALVKKPAATK